MFSYPNFIYLNSNEKVNKNMNKYPDIFGLDPLPFPPWSPGKPRRHCQHGDPYVKETTKVAEIKDRFMKTRYKVALTDFDGAPEHDDLTEQDVFF